MSSLWHGAAAQRSIQSARTGARTSEDFGDTWNLIGGRLRARAEQATWAQELRRGRLCRFKGRWAGALRRGAVAALRTKTGGVGGEVVAAVLATAGAGPVDVSHVELD